jgi:DNA mismatch repair protein MutS2
MSFAIDSYVFIKRLKKVGRVSALPRPGSYTVILGDMKLTLKESELLPSEPPKAPSVPRRMIDVPRPNRRLPPRLDLHGYTVADGIRKLDEYLNDAVIAGLAEVEILHGYGTGKLQAAVHHHLSTLSIVSGFKLNEQNGAITRVFLS